MNEQTTSHWDRTDALFRPLSLRPLEPEQIFNGPDARKATPTVGDFWRWGYSDLRDNVIRGALGEFLIASALGIDLRMRNSWDPFDLETDDGVKIEVKTSAYLQSWAQQKRSQIIFSGLKGKSWDSASGKFAGSPTYHADVYAFCVQHCVDHDDYDRLDLAQWHFYLVPLAVLKPLSLNSISESRVHKLGFREVDYYGLEGALLEI